MSIFGVFLVRIQSKCGKMWTKKTPNAAFLRIEDQGGKQIKELEELGKQLVASSSEKEFLTLLKQKTNSEELVKERMGEIQI